MDQQENIVNNGKKTFFVEVILPVPVPLTFRYRVPKELETQVAVGSRVVVEFGKRRVLTAIIAEIHHRPPEKYQAKYILEVLDDSPSVNQFQLKFWDWIVGYYQCYLGEVMQAALPSGLKLSSLSKIQLNPEFEEHDFDFTGQEQALLNTLRSEGAISYERAAEVLQLKQISSVIKKLISYKAIILFEELKERYKPKKVKKIRLAEGFTRAEANMEQLFSSLAKSPKQEQLLLAYLAKVPVYNNVAANVKGIEKAALLKSKQFQLSASSLQTLLKNGVFEEFEVIVSRIEELEEQTPSVPVANFTLNPMQQQALEHIMELFAQKDTVLLHGITGSGKTEVYIELMTKVLAGGSQVLLLLPEIVLTAQTVLRLKRVFGNLLGVYHSKFSDNERVEVWQGVKEGKYQVIVGVRSAVFLPFDNLGLIVVDEEHESSYKQYEPAPRYHARDMAIVLGMLHQAKVLLGSATPSVESYYHAQQGKYGLVSMLQRYGNAQLPEIKFADLQKERQHRTMKGEFASQLVQAIQERLEQNEQVILFQNRRGYAPYLTCEECSYIPKCENCSVSLTYHLARNELRCHYCGYSNATPRACPECGSPRIKMVGIGTEKIEDDLKNILPAARIQRMDLDTTRKKYSYQKIIADFENQQIDILVGTQMVSKGLDFDRVNLVGVFDVDRMIHFPDFRAHERTFQLVAQVSGRAGRREKPGQVIIQTANVNQPLLKLIRQHDYLGFFNREIRERQKFLYPPFARIIRLTVKSEDRNLSEKAADHLAEYLRPVLGSQRLLGPESPPIDKIRNEYLRNITIKMEKGKTNLPKAKEIIAEKVAFLLEKVHYKKVKVVVDVDPV